MSHEGTNATRSATAAALVATLGLAAGCSDASAGAASSNLSTAAFFEPLVEPGRRITFPDATSGTTGCAEIFGPEISADPSNPEVVVPAPGNCDTLTNHDARFDPATSTLGAVILHPGDVQGRFASSASLDFDFVVEPDATTIGSSVLGVVEYDVSWLGMLVTDATRGDSANAFVEIRLSLIDIMTDRVVVEALLHSADALGLGESLNLSGIDLGDAAGSFGAEMFIGHPYTLRLDLVTTVAMHSDLDTPTILADFDGNGGLQPFLGGGVAVRELSVRVGADEELIADNHRAIGILRTEAEEDRQAIADLREDLTETNVEVDALAEELMVTKDDLEELEEDFSTHTHTYLTGKGVGHNNTEAATEAPSSNE